MNINNITESVSFRIAVLGFLSLILLIPVLMIDGIIEERHQRFTDTQKEISEKWGGSQNISGPVLIVPHKIERTMSNGEKNTYVENIFILPEELNIVGSVTPSTRYRGIYKTLLYTADIAINGSFEVNSLKNLQDQPGIALKDAYIIFGVKDLKGIIKTIDMNWQGEKVKAIPGLKNDKLFASGITMDIPINLSENLDFELDLKINGSFDLFFTPVGKTTSLKLKSTWPHPIFTGAYLPTKHTIKENGFSAEWNVLNFNRNYPQQWTEKSYKISESDFGVSFKYLIDIYQKSTRTTKYAIMFISITFLTFFMIEILGKKLLHPFQYILIGFSLLTFYTLLLALSEQIGFNLSYLMAALLIIVLITMYSVSILNSKVQVLAVLGILCLLYFYLFIILQLQDFSLLIGSIGLFIILSIVMYLTRNINWFSLKKNKNSLE